MAGGQCDATIPATEEDFMMNESHPTTADAYVYSASDDPNSLNDADLMSWFIQSNQISESPVEQVDTFATTVDDVEIQDAAKKVELARLEVEKQQAELAQLKLASEIAEEKAKLDRLDQLRNQKQVQVIDDSLEPVHDHTRHPSSQPIFARDALDQAPPPGVTTTALAGKPGCLQHSQNSLCSATVGDTKPCPTQATPTPPPTPNRSELEAKLAALRSHQQKSSAASAPATPQSQTPHPAGATAVQSPPAALANAQPGKVINSKLATDKTVINTATHPAEAQALRRLCMLLTC